MPKRKVVNFGPQIRFNGGGQSSKKTKEVEIPRYTLPDYLSSHVDDLAKAAPGHRFLLYFQGASYSATVSGDNGPAANRVKKELEGKQDKGQWKQIYKAHPPHSWQPIKDTKKAALNTVTNFAPETKEMLKALIDRQAALSEASSSKVLSYHAKLSAPLAIGLGNPHPVENGFSFLSPYGLPYIPGSGVKGSVRTSAEELALSGENSGWTIPLVWILFGFEVGSGYLAPLAKETAPELRERGEQMRQAFSKWIIQHADTDQVLKWWLSKIEGQLPKQWCTYVNQPQEFCQLLQEEGRSGYELRNVISWKGLLRFWDVFPEIASLAVDILNPHHKSYFEGKCGPIEAEAPKPVFFLTIPPGAKITISIESDRRVAEVPNLPDIINGLLEDAVANCVEWVGFGAKTAVGYGVGSVVEKETEDSIKQVMDKVEEKRIEKPKKIDSKDIKEFEIQVSQSSNFPGEIDLFFQKVRAQENENLRREMCYTLLRKANSLKKDKKFSRALKNGKNWAVRLRKLLEENQIKLNYEKTGN